MWYLVENPKLEKDIICYFFMFMNVIQKPNNALFFLTFEFMLGSKLEH